MFPPDAIRTRCFRRNAVLLLSIAGFVIPRIAEAQFAVGGIYIDADGVLQETAALEAEERLKILRAEAAERPAAQQLFAGSELRKVSLSRLEQTVRQLQADGDDLPPEVRYLAGLTSLRYIFVYPEENDIVLAGPAEAWQQADSGEVVGTQTSRPVLHLDDLIVALRFAFDARPSAPFIGCSIDPTPEGMQRWAAYMRQLGGRMDRSRAQQIFQGMEQAMGPQAVRVFGIPESSRMAVKLVAADYRLKRIALGHDPSPVREVVNYLDLAAKRLNNPAAPQPQHRWWFVADYDAIPHTPDKLGFELSGQGVKVSTARTQTAGKLPPGKAPQPDVSARQFATSFTKHFEELARHVPVFAELQNVIALAVASELVSQGRAWRPNYFLQSECEIPSSIGPQHVPSLANFRIVRGRHWLISISGGVEIPPSRLVGEETLRASDDGQFLRTRIANTPPEDGQRWWWD